jgi:hypothetical protein
LAAAGIDKSAKISLSLSLSLSVFMSRAHFHVYSVRVHRLWFFDRRVVRNVLGVLLTVHHSLVKPK